MLQSQIPGLVMTCLLLLGPTGCGGDETTGGMGTGSSTSNVNPDVTAGSTVIVAILNPVVNDGHSTGVPASLGDKRTTSESASRS